MSDFDYDFFVIGAGSGGVRAARQAAGFGKKTAIAENRFLGGTCVNVGCVPKKLFVYAAEFGKSFKDAADFGWEVQTKFSWDILRDNKTKEIDRLGGIYENLLQSSNIALFRETAKIIDANQIILETGKKIRAEKILIATGGKPIRPDFPGSEHCLISDDLFALPKLPQQILIIGGGYIGIEFAFILSYLGVAVTQTLRTPQSFLRGFDHSIAAHLLDIMTRSDKITHIYDAPQSIEKQSDGSLRVLFKGGEIWQGEAVLSATGRTANLEGLGLENVGILPNQKGFLDIDENFSTNIPSIFAIGDVIGTPALTPIAIRQAMIFAANQFNNQSLRIDYDSIPKAVFAIPPIGTVGLSEEAALKKYKKIRIYQSQFRAMKYSLGMRDEKILMKLIVNDADDIVVGCHIVGPDAPEIIQLMGTIILHKISKTALDQTMPLHPSAAEELVTLSGTPEIKQQD